MDNVTHSLTGLALSRVGFNRLCPRAVWLLMLSANAPDVDFAIAPMGAFRYLEVHRGYSHSLVGLPIVAVLSVLIVAAVFREKLPWLRAWAIGLVGVASHLLLDVTNSYGVRLLLPFSSRWFYLDLNSLCDAWILLALFLAAVWPLFSRLVNREIGDFRLNRGQTSAALALLFFVAFDAGRLLLHDRVVAQLQSRLYEELPPLQAAALPDFGNPLHWTGIIETAHEYRSFDLNAISQLDVTSSRQFYKPAMTMGFRAIKEVEPFRYFLYFARFPVWSQQPVVGAGTKGVRFDLTDLRFGIPGGSSFHCIALVNDHSQIVGKWFTYGTGAELGWGEDSGNSTVSSKSSK